MMKRAATLYIIVFTLSPVKTVAFWRRVISSIRGCCQFPGLSAAGGVFFEGVVLKGVRFERCLLTAIAVEDPDMLVAWWLAVSLSLNGGGVSERSTSKSDWI